MTIQLIGINGEGEYMWMIIGIDFLIVYDTASQMK